MRRPQLAWLFCAVWLTGIAHAASGASFDCGQAATTVERHICGSEELRWLDRLTDVAYRNLIAQFDPADRCLGPDQQRWLHTVRDACGPDDNCLRRVYRLRLAEWDALLPGALRLPHPPRHLHGLARVPTLVAIIPPASDNDATGESLAVEGQLCDAEGAYAIATSCAYRDAGPKAMAGTFVARALALVDGGASETTSAILQRLASASSAHRQPHRYHFAGQRQTAHPGREEPPRFSSAHCLLIHRTD